MTKDGMDKRIRTNLIRLRVLAGYRQNVLAEKTGLVHIAHIEAGTKPAGKEAIVKLANVLNVDIIEFFMPEDGRACRNEVEKLFLELLSACSEEGRKVVMDMLISFVKYENSVKKI